jgi:hypothetical protein
MDDTQRLKLHELIRENNVQDNTENIKRLKHSQLIRNEVDKIQLLINNAQTDDFKTLDNMCLPHCSFLFTNYTNIYNKLLKKQIDLTILDKFLKCLTSIEDGVQTQHEASYEIGSLLKALYIDTKIYDEPKMREGGNLSWEEYKKMNTKMI